MEGALCRSRPLWLAHMCVGLSSWLLASGVFATAVWLIGSAPEGAKLFAHLDVSVQMPNVLTAVLVLLTPEGFVARHCVLLSAVLLAVGVLGAAWLVAAAPYHTVTTSVGLLVGGVFAGVVGSLSMSVFFPFAALTADGGGGGSVAGAIAALSAGVGGCGLVAQLLSAVSDQGRALTTAGYFGAVLGVQLGGAVAFGALLLSRRGSDARLVRKVGAVGTDGGASDDVAHVGSGAREAPPEGRADGVDAAAAGAAAGAAAAEGGAARGAAARWVARHARGARAAGWPALAGVAVTCLLEFAMPGLLPFLAPPHDESALFWLTFLWAVTSVLGRALAARRTLRRLWPPNLLQGLLLAGFVACASRGTLPPLPVSAPLVGVFSALHGLVVTSAYVMSSERGVDGAAYAGLANQAGALAGSLMSLALVSSGVLPKRG